MAMGGPPGVGGPLAGVRILDFTAYVNGPMATSLAAESGADVIKVEPPEGEGLRIMQGNPRHFAPFEVENRGKRSMTLDLKNPGALAVVERLVRHWADVICENFRPGVMDKLGLGYEQLKEWNPRIIYASNSGFGPRGEFSQDPSFDAVAQAFSGMAAAQGGGPSHSPVLVHSAFSDKVGAMTFFSAILCALVARGRTGEGQRVVTSQLGATLHFQRVDIQETLMTGFERDDGHPPWHRSSMQTGHRASDGKWLVIAAMQQSMVDRLCRDVLQRPELLEHPQLKKHGWPRCLGDVDFDYWLHGQISEVIAQAPRDRWLELCRAANVPAAPCNTYLELGDDQTAVGRHVRANGYLLEMQHRHFGPMRLAGPPTEYSATPSSAGRGGSWHAPLLGEHTQEVLQSAAGYTQHEAQDLVSRGVCPAPARRFASYAKL